MDATRSDHDYLLQVYEAVVDAGATTVNVPDTVGYAIPTRVRRRSSHGRGAGRERRRRQRPLPQRPRPRDREHARGGPGRRAPGRGHHQRPRRARRQRLARRGRHGAAHAPDRSSAAGGSRRRDRADQQRQPARLLPDRLPGPAQQGHRRAQRVRPRVGHPPGRRAQEPADLRDHDPAVGGPGRASRLSVGKLSGRRGLQGKLKELGHELDGDALDACTARPSPWPTSRRRSPTPTSSRSSTSRPPRRATPTTDEPRSASRAGA